MQSLKKAFQIGSSGGNNDAGRLIDQSEGSGARSSDKPGGFWRIAVGDAERRAAKNQEVIRNELPDILRRIDATINTARGILPEGSMSLYGSSEVQLINEVNKIKTWFDEHKDTFGVSKEEYKEIREEYLKDRKTFHNDLNKWAGSGSQLRAETAAASRVELVRSVVPFLEKVRARLEPWSTPDDSQSQSVDNPPPSTSHHGSSEQDLGLPQEDPLM